MDAQPSLSNPGCVGVADKDGGSAPIGICGPWFSRDQAS